MHQLYLATGQRPARFWASPTLDTGSSMKSALQTCKRRTLQLLSICITVDTAVHGKPSHVALIPKQGKSQVLRHNKYRVTIGSSWLFEGWKPPILLPAQRGRSAASQLLQAGATAVESVLVAWEGARVGKLPDGLVTA